MTFDPAHFKKLAAHWGNENAGERGNALKATYQYCEDCSVSITDAFELAFGASEEVARLQKEIQETNAMAEEYVGITEAKIAKLQTAGASRQPQWLVLLAAMVLNVMQIMILADFNQRTVTHELVSLVAFGLFLFWAWRELKQVGFMRLFLKGVCYWVPGLVLMAVMPSQVSFHNAWVIALTLSIAYGLVISPLPDKLANVVARSITKGAL